MTQADLARRLDVTQGFISKIEKADLRMDIVQLRAWCQAIGAPFEDFVLELDKRLRGKVGH